MFGNSSVLPCGDLVFVNQTVAYLLLMMFPVALLFNLTAAWVSLQLRTTSAFIVYFKNLIAADLLVTLAILPMAANMLPGASLHLRMFACRFSDVVLYCGLYTSICLMGMISLDRYFKIVRPRGMESGQSLVFSAVSCSVIWVFIFLGTALPTMILTDQRPAAVDKNFCMNMKSEAGVVFHKTVIIMMESVFWLVTVLILFCYTCITLTVLRSFRNSGSSNTDGMKRTKLRVFSILTVYFVCFMPLHIMRVPDVLYELMAIDDRCVNLLLSVLHRSVLWISVSNVCFDPLLYFFVCREFREKFTKTIGGIYVCLFASGSE